MRPRISKLTLAIVTLLMLASCGSADQNFVLNGEATYGPCRGKTIVMTIYHNDGTQSADTTTIDADGKFQFSGQVETPCLAEFQVVDGEDGYDVFAHGFIENSKMTLLIKEGVSLQKMPCAEITLKGSRTEKKYHRSFADVFIEKNGGITTIEPNCSEAIQANPDAVFSPYVYYCAGFYDDNYDDVVRQMEAFGPTARNTWHYRHMQQLLPVKRNLAIGHTMPDFTMPDTAGRPLRLTEVLKGKRLLLVDFWASWCSPCRMEGERIKKIYNDLHDKGLEVLGVSIDTERDRWIEALNEDQLPWPNVCELDRSDSSITVGTFGIRGVPRIVLLDAEGRVLATNLRGDGLNNAVYTHIEEGR